MGDSYCILQNFLLLLFIYFLNYIFSTMIEKTIVGKIEFTGFAVLQWNWERESQLYKPNKVMFSKYLRLYN